MAMTVEQHVTHEGLRSVLGGITAAASQIEAKIRTAGLGDALGAYGAENIQGEQQQKLDVYANRVMTECLGKLDSVAAVVSEEDEAPVTFGRDAEWMVIFDPLDGSSNIDVNVNVGTIFSVHRRLVGKPLEASTLQPGTSQVMAGYVVYGPSTVLVLTAGDGVHGFTLDPASGGFCLSSEGMRMPEKGLYYSVNEANVATWPEGYEKYVKELQWEGHSSRYIGSLVADFHRTLLKGGVFLYPPTKKQPKGKLRLLYEANPLAFVAEQAGGVASFGTGRVLEILPEQIHQRTPFMVGSAWEMERLAAVLSR